MMSLFTSTDFASACASGMDWREASKSVLEKIESIRTENDGFNFGFLYISDYLADDATSIFNLFKSVLKIDNWIGSIGMGVIGCNKAIINTPAISVMIGRLPEESFCIFPKDDSSETKESNIIPDEQDENIFEINLEKQSPRQIPQDTVQQWLVENTPMLGIVHADPFMHKNPQETLLELEATTGCFVVGGLTSSRSHHYQIANQICDSSLCGAFFSDKIQLSTTISQGCEIIGVPYTITKSDNDVILELEEKPALTVLQEILHDFASKKLGKSTVEISRSFDPIEAADNIPSEFESLFQGQIHIAIPNNHSDQKDFQVLNITGIDADEGSISISDDVLSGTKVFFVERDSKSMASDLSKSLIALRKRIMAETGDFNPKGAIYISCIARGYENTYDQPSNEMDLIHDIIGDIPIAGFYAAGEINNSVMYSYAGVLTLFF